MLLNDQSSVVTSVFAYYLHGVLDVLFSDLMMLTKSICGIRNSLGKKEDRYLSDSMKWVDGLFEVWLLCKNKNSYIRRI